MFSLICSRAAFVSHVSYLDNSAVMVDTAGEWPQCDGASWNVAQLRLVPLQLGATEAEDVRDEAQRSGSYQCKENGIIACSILQKIT